LLSSLILMITEISPVTKIAGDISAIVFIDSCQVSPPFAQSSFCQFLSD
jgi:cystathionine beta-lyase/cystathionine gamma-synthase